VSTPPEPGSTGTPAPDDHVIVLFGATGDLAARKLLPGFFRLAEVGLMPADFRIVGTSRRAVSDDDFRTHAHDVIAEFGRSEPAGTAWTDFSARLSYASSDASDMSALAAAVTAAETDMGGSVRRLHYLSIPPMAMDGIVSGLGSAGLADAATRVILEKPFGTDVDSAEALDALLHTVFAEDQIFRIDHFLGKEDVQNILAVRFSNRLFEPVWCKEHVQNIQIDVPEALGVENRARFYEETGAFRDMVVTHLIQALGFVAMEPPASFTAEALADAKQAVFDALQPLDPSRVVRGQYDGDELVFEIGEPGSIRVTFQSKEPGPTMTLGEAHLDFVHKQSFDPRCELEAYERLLHDAVLGDRTLFNRADGIERLWEVAVPLLDSPRPVQPYAPGTWGPAAVDDLIGPRGWYLPD